MRLSVPRLVPATVVAIAGVCAAQNWTLFGSPGPAAATFPRMVYDSQRGVCVEFGGWNAPFGTIVFQNTWEFDGVTWTQRFPATIPNERDSHSMAYDSARGRTLMFGGWDFNFVLLGQTWEWDGTNWLNRLPANAPSARKLSAMAYDVARGVTVLFGGIDAAGFRNDTWEWNGTNWVQRATPAPPGARTSHAMAYDVARGRTVMFGGFDGTNQLADTWEWDGNVWVNVTTDGAPPARVDHQLAYDAQRARIVLFGGADLVVDRDDTWEYDGVRWHQLFTVNRPQGNSAMAIAYDIARGSTVVFGGFGGVAAIPSTWELRGNAATYRAFGTPCVGSGGLSPRLLPVVMPSLGATTRVDVTDLPPAPGFVYLAAGFSDQTWGPVALPFDLSPFGLTGCRGYTSADAGLILAHGGGTATWTLPMPSTPSLSGAQLFLQALSLDAGAPRPFPGAMSDAAELNVR